MRRNARFWRNVILIALVHLGALVALLRWAGSSKIAAAQEITWLTTGGEPMETADLAKAEETPTPDPDRKSPPSEENQPATTPAESEIQIAAAANPANTSWYGNMLHDRFYREWEQPTTVVASGAKLSASAKIRIEKDGRISDFKIVRSSGNVVVDESVEAVGKKVTRVDALPAGIGSGGHYDVNINFALNSK